MIVNRNYPIILYFFLQTLMERTLVAIMTILERIQELAQKKDKNLKEISLELGFSKNYLYSLKKQAPSSDKLSKLADYFGVSTDYLLGRTDDKASLSPKEIEDIGQMADRMINGLESENSVNFYGEPMSDEDKASLKTALLVALEMNKKRSKQKD